jgi:hypothetical protein
MRQTITKHTSHANAGNKAGRYIPENEPASIGQAGHRALKTCGTPKLNLPPPPLLSTIHWTSEVRQRDHNAPENDGN